MRDLSAIDMSNYLPHRPPFLMVDRVLELDHDSVVTSLKIKKDSVFVEEKVFNEAGLVEFAAQTCSAIVGKNFFSEEDVNGESNKLIGFISSIKELEIYEAPEIGSTIKASAQLISNFDSGSFSLSTMRCTIFEGKKDLLSCELILFIREERDLK